MDKSGVRINLLTQVQETLKVRNDLRGINKIELRDTIC